MKHATRKILSGLLAAFAALYMAGCPDITKPKAEPEKPDAPKGVQGTPALDSIALSWDPVDGATGYTVYAGTSPDSLSKKGNTTKTTYTITGLSPDTRYYAAVAAKNTEGEGARSDPVETTTLKTGHSIGVPDAPKGIQGTPGSNSIDLSWNPVDGATEYVVYAGTSQDSMSLRETTANTAYTITGLSPDTRYYAAVAAKNAEGEGARSDPVETTTLKTGHSIGVPEGLKGEPGTNSIDLSWNPVDGATEYRVYAGTSQDNMSLRETTANTAYTITGLSPDTRYYAAVAAKNAEGEGARSDPVETTTLKANVSIGVPEGLKGEPGTNTIDVSWNPVDGATEYVVYAGTSGDNMLRRGTTEQTAHTLTLLSSGTEYHIAVAAVQDGEEGAKSGAITVTTQAGSGKQARYTKEYWGEWLRMDTGDTWYIASTDITVNGEEFQSQVALEKQSSRVVKVTEGGREYYLYASRVASSRFTGKIALVQESTNSRSARALSGGGLGGIQVVIAHLPPAPGVPPEPPVETNPATGSFETPPDIIIGDSYEVTPVEPDPDPVTGDPIPVGPPVIVTPEVPEEDIGTITVVESGQNIKARLTPQSPDVDMAFLYAGIRYYFDLALENTGNADWRAASYELDFGSAITTSPTTGILGTLEPGKTRIIPLTLTYNASPQGAAWFHRIGIKITDLRSGKIWEDSVSLKIHKGTVDFNIRASGNVAGIIITPDSRAWHFSGSSSTITLPISEEDYLVVFSGATADTEVVYSFGVDVNAPNVPASPLDADPSTVMLYEPNDTEDTAARIDGSSVTAYLDKNDIDYYLVNLAGSGGITIHPPVVPDENINGFPPAPLTLSRSQADGAPASRTITAAEGYDSYGWYVDGILRGNTRSITLDAARYGLGKHTFAIVVTKNGVPWSKEQSFTVTE